ncbi:MAG TPA: MFS transporter, partial [Lacipirellulaceae bacterium]|nr:MFS transporter [Lacipirellulaceae bacterium]
DLHLYTIVATPFVAELLAADQKSDAVREKSSWIQAAFLVGWALGGGFFGRVGDRLGRSRALMLTILTYAMFTGLAYFARSWQELLVYRFLAALGIGGEWAVGASLLSETWPAKWRHWIAAVLQTGVNLGILLAMLAGYVLLPMLKLSEQSVFLVGVLPALLVFWIRRAVPEPAEWRLAQKATRSSQPRFIELFQGRAKWITVPAILVCATSLTGHWAFMFWFAQHMRNVAEAAGWSASDQSRLPIIGLTIMVGVSIIGNFAAGAVASRIGYRAAIVALCIAYFASMFGAYRVPRSIESMWAWLTLIGLCQGVFALFTMYLPPLFPTLLRTTGAGFCYNIGRLAAAFGTIELGKLGDTGNYQTALYYTSFLFLFAAAFALLLPELPNVRAQHR